jgi:hypothetical protein
MADRTPFEQLMHNFTWALLGSEGAAVIAATGFALARWIAS